MPIHCELTIQSPTTEEFRELDFKVMKHAFDTQNSIGRLADERVYQADLALRLHRAGLQVHREVEVQLVHKTFQKSLFLDHVVGLKAVYELKVVKVLTDAHRSQLMTYLYLLNLARGKLITFGPEKTESEFINAPIPFEDRISFSIDRFHYSGPDSFEKLVVDLLRDWGTSLNVALYQEAVESLLGGTKIVDVMLPMRRDGFDLGTQRFQLASPNEGFHITAMTRENAGYQSHLERLLRLSPLRQLHWVNIGRHELRFLTIRK